MEKNIYAPGEVPRWLLKEGKKAKQQHTMYRMIYLKYTRIHKQGKELEREPTKCSGVYL